MIDILMATYNGEKYLTEQLMSISNQTYTDWRLTVCDDGSTDRTWAILTDFREIYGLEKIILKKNIPPTGSARDNFLRMIQQCDGNYFMCCDQDDVWHSDKVERSLYRLRQMEERYGKEIPLLVYTDLRVVDENLSELGVSFHRYMNLRTGNYLEKELIQNQVTGCTMIFNRALKVYAEMAKNYHKIVMHDHWLAIIASVFGQISYLNQATIDYRQHTGNSVGAQNAKSFGYMWKRFCLGKLKFRQDMVNSSIQCRYFLQQYATCINNDKVIKLLKSYAFLYKNCKIIRIFLFFRYGFWKKGIIRKIMQIIWG